MTKTFNDYNELKKFIINQQKLKTTKSYNITYKHHNKVKRFSFNGKTKITKERSINTINSYIQWVEAGQDGAELTRRVFNSVNKEYLITIGFKTNHGNKYIHKIQNGDIKEKKAITTQNAIEQYYQINNIYGTSYNYPIRITKQKIVRIVRTPAVEQELKQTKLKAKYYVVGDEIFKYSEFDLD